MGKKKQKAGREFESRAVVAKFYGFDSSKLGTLDILLYEHWIEPLKCREMLEKARIGEIQIQTWRGWYEITLRATGDKEAAEDAANEWALEILKKGGKFDV